MKPAEVLARYGNALRERLIAELELSPHNFVDGSELEHFLEADPDRHHKNLEWLVRSYIEGGISIEDLYSKVRPALINYKKLIDSGKLSKGNKPWENETVIDNFCGLSGCIIKGRAKPGLLQVLDKYKEVISSFEPVRGQRQIIEGQTIRIIIPKDRDAALYYGQGTRWCTAATKSFNEYDHYDYYSKSGSLYIVIPRSPTRSGEKYQLHGPSFSFMNEADEHVPILMLYKKYPELHELLPLDTLDIPTIDGMILAGDQLTTEWPYIYVVSNQGPPLIISTGGAFVNVRSKYDYAENVHLEDDLPPVNIAEEYPALLSPEAAKLYTKMIKHNKEASILLLMMLNTYGLNPNYLDERTLRHVRENFAYSFMNKWDKVKSKPRITIKSKT